MAAYNFLADATYTVVNITDNISGAFYCSISGGVNISTIPNDNVYFTTFTFINGNNILFSCRLNEINNIGGYDYSTDILETLSLFDNLFKNKN